MSNHMKNRFKLVSDIEHADGTKVFSIELGRYETREEAKARQLDYEAINMAGDTPVLYTNFDIIDLYSELDEKTTSLMFKLVVNLCIEHRFAFQIGNASMMAEDDPLLEYLPNGCFGTDLRFIYIIIGNQEWVVNDYDTETLTQIYEELETLL